MKTQMLTLFVVAISAAAFAAHAEKSEHHSPYAGQQNRAISSLSNADVEELTRGGGWGLAKAAELNGLPGPAHLLELQDEIGLSPEQVDAITVIRDEMRIEAKRLGAEMIELESALDAGFRSQSFTQKSLRAALDQIARVRGELRFSHLSAHLQTPSVLNESQIARYNQLRGYTSNTDPCANVPQGHNASMWRKHNGCE